MIPLTAATPILVATAPADFRRAIDGFVALCQHGLGQDPRSGTLYVFINRARTMVRILAYESGDNEAGRGYWLMTKRLSRGRFRGWPRGEQPLTPMAAQRLRQLLNAMLDCGDD
jgi:transposase